MTINEMSEKNYENFTQYMLHTKSTEEGISYFLLIRPKFLNREYLESKRKIVINLKIAEKHLSTEGYISVFFECSYNYSGYNETLTQR